MCIVYSNDCAVQIKKKRHDMATPAINSKGNMKLKCNCGKPLVEKRSGFYCLISNSHLYYTQNSSSATPGHVHCTAQSVQLFFFFSPFTQVGYCFSNARAEFWCHSSLLYFVVVLSFIFLLHFNLFAIFA